MDIKEFIGAGVLPQAIENSGANSAQMRIATALLAFAGGDAIGVEYEIHDAPPVQIERMGTRDDWPWGGVSDDTLLSLITIETFAKKEKMIIKTNKLIRFFLFCLLLFSS